MSRTINSSYKYFLKSQSTPLYMSLITLSDINTTCNKCKIIESIFFDTISREFTIKAFYLELSWQCWARQALHMLGLTVVSILHSNYLMTHLYLQVQKICTIKLYKLHNVKYLKPALTDKSTIFNTDFLHQYLNTIE